MPLDEIVTRADLEADLARLQDADPAAGILGPGSAMWTVGRESVVLLAGGRAALLQIAHPYVAHAIAQHSKVFDDLALRFRRTLGNVYAMTFGRRDLALNIARRVHAIHEHIEGTIYEELGAYRRGDRYRANEPDALRWVAATLWDSSVDLFERTVRPLTPAEHERYWQDARRWCCLFGFAESWLPADWPDFCRYRDRMLASPRLAVGDTARHIARHILAPPRPAAAPMYRWLRVFTAGLLPPRFRRDFGLPYGHAERAVFRASLGALRRTVPHLPASLRFTPAYHRATRRLEGQEGGDPVADALRRLALALVESKR